MNTYMYTHSYRAHLSDWQANLKKRVHHNFTMQVSVVLIHPLRGLTSTMPHSPVRRNITEADIKQSHVKRAGGGAKPWPGSLTHWVASSWSHIGCRDVGGGVRGSFRGTVRLLGPSPHAFWAAAGTVGCKGMNVYVCVIWVWRRRAHVA